LLYNYFESKEDVLKNIIRSGYEAAYNHLELNKEGVLVQDQFIHFLRMTFKAIQENRHFWQLYSALMFQQGILDVALGEYEGKALMIQKLMTDFLKAMGSKDSETDLLAISSLIKGASVILITAPDFFPADKLEATIIDSCFRLITTKENSGTKEGQKVTGKTENITTIQ
ncbi:MAG TPA: TetR/AcrR family transcriptional regulator, partial [Prolixibacteraceae bacterium]|nr:TetR/AcrR family transcriptional regulator [Prolixibacteraceae bacterium]